MAEGSFDPRYNPGHEEIRVPAAEKEPEVAMEPLLWGLFSLGGFLTAFLLPVTIVAISFLVPLGFWPAGRTGYDWLASALDPSSFLGIVVRLFFLLLIAGSFFHAAHRFTYVLVEAGLQKHHAAIGFVFHALAVLGSLAALYYVLKGWLL